MIGESLGPYRILEPLGAGGMGEVYLGEDTRLGRKVAIKVLPEQFAADPERLARFEREAKTVAALDHPNIVTVYSVEEVDGCRFITMQLVEGQTLSALLPRRGFDLERLFALVVPLTEALAAAHEQGITHRDLKPANIMVAGDGRVKVLDFGLAKLQSDAPGADVVTAAGTQAADLTEEGKILGTVSYMSPEQAEGKPVDPRSDVFSLGILIYEMATGERPFQGDTTVSIISSLVKDTPTQLTDLNRNLPRHLGRIVNKCLDKDPKRRYQSALGLRNDLDKLAIEVASGEAVPTTAMSAATKVSVATTRRLVAGAMVLAVALAAYWLLPRLQGEAPPPPIWRTVQLTTLPGAESDPSLSPDGDEFVYAGDAEGNLDIYLQKVDGATAINLTGDSPENDWAPAYSPNGQRIAFRSEREGGGIWVMGPTGENPRRVTDEGHQPAWSPDGTRIAYGTFPVRNPYSLSVDQEIRIVDLDSGETRRLTDGYQPSWSPSGSHVAYVRTLQDGSGLRDIYTIAVDGSEPVAVTQDAAVDWGPIWAPAGGHLYFSSNRGGADNIWRIAVDPDTGAPIGEPLPVTSGGSELQGYLSISADGRRLALSSSFNENNLGKIAFDPVNETTVGDPTWITEGAREVEWYDVSPDGEWLVFSDSRRGQQHLFKIRTDGTDEYQLTDNEFRENRPRWSPAGDRIAVYTNREDGYEIWTFDADGANPRRLTSKEGSVWDPIWSPDGKRLVLWNAQPAPGGQPRAAYLIDAGILTMEPDLEPLAPPEDGGAALRVTSWSPDGTKLAGTRGPIPGIWVYTFASKELRRVGDTGGAPTWLSDSRRLIYRTGIHTVALLDSVTGETKEIFFWDQDRLAGGGSLAASSDDRTIYLVRRETGEDVHLLVRE